MTAIDPTTLRILAEALLLGLLVGAERYRGRKPGEPESAGVRTFAIVALLGAVCGVIAHPGVTIATFAAVAALVLVGYYRSPAGSLGLTTEYAALLVFWIGYLLSTHEAAAIGLGIVLTIFLASKRKLHDFVRDQVSAIEFEATLKFLAVVLVVYPILPDRDLGPQGFFNPRQLWTFVIVVSTIGFAGYFLKRWLGNRRGLLLGSLAGGFVSTTAVTLSLAGRSREVPGAGRLFGAAAVLGNAVQAPRLLLLLWVVDRDLALELTPPLVAMTAVGFVGAWVVSRAAGDAEVELPLDNPYSLRPALRFGLYYLAIVLGVRLAEMWLGEGGVLIASGIAGAGSVSAVVVSIGELVSEAALPLDVAARAVVVGLATNAAAKGLVAWLHGSRTMALWLLAGLVAMVGVAVGVVVFW